MNRQFRLYAAIICVLYLIIGIGGSDLHIVRDGREYLQMATHLLNDGAFTYDGTHPVIGKPPGFPAIIAGAVSLGASVFVLQIVLMVFLFACYLFIAIAARRWLSERAGYAVLGILVLVWPLYYFVHNLLSEAAFLAFTALSLYALMRLIDDRQWHWAVLCGVASGLSTYMRPINVFWPFLALVVVVIVHRLRWKPVLTVAVIHLVILLPWVVRNYQVTGRVIPMAANWGPVYYMTDEDLWRTYLLEGPGAVQSTPEHAAITQGEYQFNPGPSERFRELALTRIVDDPGAYLWRCVRQAAFAWAYVPGTKDWYASHPGWFLVGRVCMLFAYVILAMGIWTASPRRNAMSLVAILYAVYTAAIVFPVCTESRYLIPAYLWLLPLGLTGIMRLWSLFVRRPEATEAVASP